MKLSLAAILTTIGLLSAGPALAEEKPLVMIELFTSQGCSSCPPADALIEELAGRDDVLPLALHVDYWDYIGWTDNFARPQNTQRQKAYARMAGEGSIYTPQMVVSGVEHIMGYRPMVVAELIQHYRMEEVPVLLEADETGTMLHLKGWPRAGAMLPGEINIDLVGFIPQATIKILHGENAGATVTYANIVTSWDRLGLWNGQGAFELAAPVPEEGPLAVIVQETGPGRVLAAFRVR